MKNYLRLKTWSFARVSYLFVDTVQLFYILPTINPVLSSSHLHHISALQAPCPLTACLIWQLRIYKNTRRLSLKHPDL